MTPARFYELAALLPEGHQWGDALTPNLLEHIFAAAAKGAPVLFVSDKDLCDEERHFLTGAKVATVNRTTPLYTIPPALQQCCWLDVYGTIGNVFGYSFLTNNESNLHKLAPGHYRVFVQAINSKDEESGENKSSTNPLGQELLTDNCGND